MVRQSRRDRGGNSRKHHQATKEVDAAIRQVLSNLSSDVVSKMVAQEAEKGAGGVGVDVRTSGSHGNNDANSKYRCSTGAEMFSSLVQLLCNNITLLHDAAAPSSPRHGTLQSNHSSNNTLTSPQVVTLVEFLYSYLSWLLPPVPAFPSSLPTTTASPIGAGGVGAMVIAAAHVVLEVGGVDNNSTSSSAVVVLSSATTSRYACPRIPQFACDFIYRNRVIDNTDSVREEVAANIDTPSEGGGGVSTSACGGPTLSSPSAVEKTPPLPELPAQPTPAVLKELERLPLSCAEAVSRALGDGWECVNSADSQYSSTSHIAPIDKVFAMQAMMYLLCYRLVGMYPRWVLLTPGSMAALAAECVTILHTEALFTQQRSEGIEQHRRSMRSRGGVKNRKWKEKRQQQLKSSLSVCPRGTKQTGSLTLLSDKRSKKRAAISLSAILAACKQPTKGAADTLFLLTGLQVIVVEVMCLMPPTTPCNPNAASDDDEGMGDETEEEVPGPQVTDQHLPIDRNYIPPSPSVSDSAERESSCDGSDHEEEASCACVGGFLLSWILSSAETRAVMMTGRNEARLSSGGVVVGGAAAIYPSIIPRQQHPTNHSPVSKVSTPTFQQQRNQDTSGGGIDMRVSIVADLLFTFRGTSTPAEALWDTPSFATDKYEAVARTVLDACMPDTTPTGNPAKAVTSTSFLKWLRNIPKSAKRPVEVLPRVMILLGSWEAGVNSNSITYHSNGALLDKKAQPARAEDAGDDKVGAEEENEWSLLERLPTMLSNTSSEWLEQWLPLFLRRWRAVDTSPSSPEAAAALNEPRGPRGSGGGSNAHNQIAAQKEQQRRNVSTLEERLRVIIQSCSTMVQFYLPSATTTPSQRIHGFMVGVHAVCATILEAVNSAFDRAVQGNARSMHTRQSTPQHHGVYDTSVPELPSIIKAVLVLARPLSMGVVPTTNTTTTALIAPSVLALYTSHMNLIKGTLLPPSPQYPASTNPPAGIDAARAITTQLMNCVRSVIEGPSQMLPLLANETANSATSHLHISEQNALVAALPGLLYHLTAVVGDASNRPAGTIGPLNQSWFLEVVDFLLTILNVRKYKAVVGGNLPAYVDLGMDALRSWGSTSRMESGAVVYHSIGPLITSQLLPLLRQLQVQDDTVPHLIAASFFADVRMYHHADVPRHISAPVMAWLRSAVLEYNIVHTTLQHLSTEIQSLTGSSGPSVTALEMAGLMVEAVALLCATSENDVEANRSDACTLAMRVSNDLWQLCHLLLDQDFSSSTSSTNAADAQSAASTPSSAPQHPPTSSSASGVVVGYYSRRGVLATSSPLQGIHGFFTFQRRLNTVHTLLDTLMASAAYYPSSSLAPPDAIADIGNNTPTSTSASTPSSQELILLQLLGFVSHHVHIARSTSRVRSLKGTMPTSLSQRYELAMLGMLGTAMESYGALPLIDSLRIATTSYTPAQTAACRRYTETVVKTLLVLIKYYWVSAAPDTSNPTSTKEEMESMKHLNMAVTGRNVEEGSIYRVTEVDLACVTCLRGVLARVPFSNIQLPFIPEAASRIIGLLMPPASRLRHNAAAKQLGGNLITQLVGLAHDTFEHCMAVASEARTRRIQHRKNTHLAGGSATTAQMQAESEDTIVFDTPNDLDNDDVKGLLSRSFIAYALPSLQGIVRWEAKTVSSRFIIQDEPSPAGLLGSLKVLTTIFAYVDVVGTSGLLVPPASSQPHTNTGLLSDLNTLIKSFMGQPLGAKRPRDGEEHDSGDDLSRITSPALPTMTVSGGPPSCIQAALQSSRAALMGLTRCICASKGFDGETILLDAGGSHSERSAPSSSPSSDNEESSSDSEDDDSDHHDPLLLTSTKQGTTTAALKDDITTTATHSTSSPSTLDDALDSKTAARPRVGCSRDERQRRRMRREERDVSMNSLYEAVRHISGLESTATPSHSVNSNATTTTSVSPICSLRDTVLTLIHATALAISTGTMSALDGVTTIGDAYQTLVACLDCATAARRWLDVMGPTLHRHTASVAPHHNTSHLAPRLYLLPLVVNVRDVLVADLPQWKIDLKQQRGIAAVPSSLVQAVEWVRAFLDQYSLARVVTGISVPQPPAQDNASPSSPSLALTVTCDLDDDLTMLTVPRPPQVPSTPTPPQPPQRAQPSVPPPSTSAHDQEYANLTSLQQRLVDKLATLMTE